MRKSKYYKTGFNNHGSEIVSKRIADNLPSGFLGINIDLTKIHSKIKEDDYIYKYLLTGYITINISSPNTEGLRDFHKKELEKI